jgi:chemotaxis response regulator CheB
MRRTVAEMLSDEDDVTVVGECGDGSQVVETAARICPDVVLMVLSMPVMNGTATEAVRAVRPEAGIVMVTGEGHAARRVDATAGAQAMVPEGPRARGDVPMPAHGRVRLPVLPLLPVTLLGHLRPPRTSGGGVQ